MGGVRGGEGGEQGGIGMLDLILEIMVKEVLMWFCMEKFLQRISRFFQAQLIYFEKFLVQNNNNNNK